MKRDASLPCSKQPATRPYPELVQANPHQQILFRLDRFEHSLLIYGRCSSACPIKTTCAVLTSMFVCTCPAHLISLDLITLTIIWWSVKFMQFSTGKHGNKSLLQISSQMRRNSGSFNNTILSSAPIIPQWEFFKCHAVQPPASDCRHYLGENKSEAYWLTCVVKWIKSALIFLTEPFTDI
jgi:hypothetical protein